MARQGFEKNKSNIKKIDGGAMPKRRKKRRRSSYARIMLVIIVLAVTVVGTVLSMTVFFKIKSIDVYGETIYSSKQIIDVGKIKLESNLIRLDSRAVEERIEKSLPFVAEAKIYKRLPTTVDINVTAAQTAGYIETKGGIFEISTEGKILSKLKKIPSGMAKIEGLGEFEAKVSEFVPSENEALSYVTRIYTELGKAISKDITSVNVSDRINLSFVYRDRITVKLGSETDLNEKLKFVLQLLVDSEKINQDDIGIIYATNAKRISFLRKGSYLEMQQQLELEKEQNSISSSVAVEENGQNIADKPLSSDTGTSSKKEN